jgi:hypothetical protein
MKLLRRLADYYFDYDLFTSINNADRTCVLLLPLAATRPLFGT